MKSNEKFFDKWVLTHPDNLDLTAYEENIMFDAWLAAKQQAVPIDTMNEVLGWGNCAFNECWSDEQRDEIERHYKIIEAMIQEAQK